MDALGVLLIPLLDVSCYLTGRALIFLLGLANIHVEPENDNAIIGGLLFWTAVGVIIFFLAR
jgi:hypothetical protein